jgi:hypothetical protein
VMFQGIRERLRPGARPKEPAHGTDVSTPAGEIHASAPAAAE